MSINSAFNPQGLTFNITTNATPSTASAQIVSFAPGASTATGSGLTFCPQCVRVVNTGATVVYISFTTALRVAVIPAAATPSQEFPVLPNSERVFNLPQPANVSSATPYTLQVNTISTGTSIVLNATFGEGQ